MDRSAPFLPQWNSAERAPHRVNNPDLEGLLASNIFFSGSAYAANSSLRWP
jgi:hypothetical protein